MCVNNLENNNERSLKFEEMKKMIFLALPIILGQLAGFSMTFVDTAMSGRAGAEHMAAVAVATSFWYPITLFGQGLMMSITPFVAQIFTSAFEGDRHEKMASYFRQGIWAALFISVLLLVALISSIVFILPNVGFEADVTSLAIGYLSIMLLGVVPFMIYVGLKVYLDGLGLTRPTMFCGIIALAFNIPLNYIFIFGKFGMPALGAVGCAIATVTVQTIMALCMAFFAKKAYSKVFTFAPIDWNIIKRIFRVSLPNAVALLMETSIFSFIALFLAPFGKEVVAGHQAAMNAGSVLFMIPLGFSIAVSVRTGNMLGATDIEGVKRVRKVAFMLSLVIGLFNASVLVFFRDFIASLYTNDPIVSTIAVSFLFYCAIYQIVDAIQVVSIAIIRGYNDTKALFVCCLISYWFVALPIGYTLSFYGFPFIPAVGPYGFWIGISFGLSFAAILLMGRIFFLERQSVDNIIQRFSR